MCPKGITSDETQNQRHPPCKSHKQKGPGTGTKGILAQKAKLLLQPIEGSAMRHEEPA
jgi:hypothetical protein